jgi:hypothetical protein
MLGRRIGDDGRRRQRTNAADEQHQPDMPVQMVKQFANHRPPQLAD